MPTGVSKRLRYAPFASSLLPRYRVSVSVVRLRESIALNALTMSYDKKEKGLFGKYDGTFDVICATVLVLTVLYFVYQIIRVI